MLILVALSAISCAFINSTRLGTEVLPIWCQTLIDSQIRRIYETHLLTIYSIYQ